MKWLALGAGYVLLIQAVVTAFEIVSRKLFNHSFQGVDELGGYALAIAGAVGFGYAAITCAHTRIDLLLSKLPLAGRAVLHVLAAFVLMIVASGMFWYGLRSLRQSISFGAISTTPLQTPLWIPQGIWVTGLALFLLITVVIAGRCVILLSRRDFAGIEKQMKAKSQEQQELEAAGFGDKLDGAN
ncbi:TRAP transporter small permease [Marinovum sp.]|uniref:TRAP transporter small permease subunit n=1 Tax=Marinovum sp. TaxID=2024839 RepID=UPI002B26F40F|nr:TRAP transporter small permease [Marinovum sp.]